MPEVPCPPRVDEALRQLALSAPAEELERTPRKFCTSDGLVHNGTLFHAAELRAGRAYIIPTCMDYGIYLVLVTIETADTPVTCLTCIERRSL